MTEEELEKEAEKYADGIYHYKINVSDYGEDGIINYRYSDVKEAYQKGAESREKEIKNKISEHKECCKKLAEEYRQRYNEDNTDKLALNMFYHNVISFNDFEIILATIEDRNSIIMCFSEPPILTEETVEVNIKRIAELEKENAELKDCFKIAKDNEYEYQSLYIKAKELLSFWVNDFYDNSRNSNRYEERHKALEQSEQFLKEHRKVEK